MKVLECEGRSRSVVQEHPAWWSQVKPLLEGSSDLAEEIRVEGFDYGHQTGFLLVLSNGEKQEVRFETRKLKHITPTFFLGALRQVAASRCLEG